ncbi:MAG: hypothetical protein ACE5GN_06790, partial [Waddliaceae bacterium]
MYRSGMDKAMAILRTRAPANELDYGFVMDCLKGYRSPRAKLTKLLNTGALLRVKKGLYAFGTLFVRGSYSLETLANLIYGPSYVSLEWALQFYGMIPEKVEEITSVTFKRKKTYETPLGRFSYAHRHPDAYPVGITCLEANEYQNALIATPEKALTDLLVIRRGRVSSIAELEKILYEDLRIEAEDLVKLRPEKISRIQKTCPHSTIG